MAFTEITRNSSIVTRTTAQTATDAKFLSVAPSAGQWIVVALYTNQGIIPSYAISGANNLVTSVTCGTTTPVSLSLLESALSTSINSPTVFIAPYQAGMDTRVQITWTNGIASTTLGVAIMVFSGSVTGASSGYNQFRTSGVNGAFDGSGNVSAGFGLSQAAGSSGIISWADSNAIQTNYDVQGEVFICAMTCTASFNVNQPRQFSAFGASIDGSGNVTTLGQSTGTVVINNASSVVTSGKGVIYSPSGNFVFTYTGVNTGTNTLTGCTTSAPSTASIPAYCQLMLSSNATSTITSVLPTTSLTSGTLGGFQIGNSATYTGVNTANGHIQTAITGGTTPVRLDLMLGSNVAGTSTVKAYGTSRISGSNVPVNGGFIYTMVPATRTITRYSLANRILSSRALKIYAKVKTGVASLISLTSVSKLRKAPRSAKTTVIGVGKQAVGLFKRFSALQGGMAYATKQRVANRLVTATQVNATQITKNMRVFRNVQATVTYSIASNRQITMIRRASATAVALVRVIKQSITKTHAGTVGVGWQIASVKGGFVTASVTGSETTATVKRGVIFLTEV